MVRSFGSRTKEFLSYKRVSSAHPVHFLLGYRKGTDTKGPFVDGALESGRRGARAPRPPTPPCERFRTRRFLSRSTKWSSMPVTR